MHLVTSHLWKQCCDLDIKEAQKPVFNLGSNCFFLWLINIFRAVDDDFVYCLQSSQLRPTIKKQLNSKN